MLRIGIDVTEIRLCYIGRYNWLLQCRSGAVGIMMKIGVVVTDNYPSYVVDPMRLEKMVMRIYYVILGVIIGLYWLYLLIICPVFWIQ